MATADLQTYIEDRLRVAFPTVDLSPGSPAQVSFVAPLLARLGTDPFDTDIDSFITDRFKQEFPTLYAGDPSAIRDTFVKPLILILEPLKREIETIKKNQSLADPTQLSDEDADALVANVFDYRSSGQRASGSVRVFFSNPSNQKAEITDVAYTADGLNFTPIGPVSISAEEMVFNRQGSLFYFDIPVQAEKDGVEYNVEAGTIVGYRGLSGYVKVTNPRRITDGSQTIDTPSFVAQARESLNERSLVSRRGASARIRQRFQGDVRAVQVIGAGDKEMMRDILVAEGPGHTWLTGKVSLYRNIAYVQCLTVDGTADAPQVGDTLYFYSGGKTEKVKVAEVIGPDFGVAPGGIVSTFMVRWEGDFDPPAQPVILWGGFTRKGTIRISSLPSIGKVSLEVANQEVHVFGHTDIYVRPVVQGDSKAILSNLSDLTPLVARTTLQTFGAAAEAALTSSADDSVRNRVEDTGYDFAGKGVLPGDLLLIEEGDDAGTYVIGKVAGDKLYLSSSLSQTKAGLRYRISRSVVIDPFDPKILKLPFGAVLANDAQTTIDSNIIRFQKDVLNYGARIGDVIRFLTGLDKGDFTITGFQSGFAVIVDRPALSSSAGLHYELFTPLDKVERPLVRVKEIALLDSSRKSTGILVPPAHPVAVVPQSDFTTAQVRGRSSAASGFVLPALNDGVVDYVTGADVAADPAAGNDRRYSLGFDPSDGIYKAAAFDDDTEAELLFPQDANTCSYFLMTCEDNSKAENFPPAEPKAGDALTVKSGPNKGSYLVRQVRKFKYRDEGKTFWLYFVQIHGTFPVDVFRQLITFLEDNGETVDKITGGIVFPDFFTTGFYDTLGEKLDAALVAKGATSPGAAALQAAADQLLKCEYEWGDPARGVLRSYFLQPTVAEQSTADAAVPTMFDFKAETGEVVTFRPDPVRYEKHEIVPARLIGDANPIDYPRNLAFTGADAAFLDDGVTVFNRMVRIGDVLEVFDEVFANGLNNTREMVVRTAAGSTKVTAPAGSFSPEVVGNLLAIEESMDRGVYRVVGRVDDKNIILDRPLKLSTSPVIGGGTCTIQTDGGFHKVTKLVGDAPLAGWAGKYVTVYDARANRAGVEKDIADSYLCGSYLIEAVVGDEMRINRATDFPAPENARFLVTDAPSAAPKAYGNGTELVAARPVRVYSDVTSKHPITQILASPVVSMVGVGLSDDGAAPRLGYRQPFRVYRKNCRRITSTEMDANRDGFLRYFDTEVVSTTPSPLANIKRNSYLTTREGTYQSVGYRHQVQDNTLSYSMKEEGILEFPASLLPVNSPDSPDNLITLAGTPVQITYERADAVEQLQEFLDSAEDRVTAANMLARHFLPSYISYDATYSGGSSPSVVVRDIVDYINNLGVEAPVDVSELEERITQRGGNPKTPTKVSATIHDWDRRMWVEFSEDELGGTVTRVPYNGTPRVTYCIPGADATGVEVTTERLKLTNS